MGRKGLEELGKCFHHLLWPLARFIKFIDENHHGADGGIETHALNVFAHLLHCFVKEAIHVLGHRVFIEGEGFAILADDQAPNAVNKTSDALDTLA